MTTPYRQSIPPGVTGGDVLAVKRAYIRMHITGAGGLALTRTAGAAFVSVTRSVQLQHRLPADGVYGYATHQVVAPFFDLYGAFLYRTAAIRKPVPPPAPVGNAQSFAKKLLAYSKTGEYHADNPADLPDIIATANGKPVWSQAGRWVHIDPHPLQLLCWLIEEEHHRVGTYAICSDHSNDGGTHGHAAGFAVDISSIDGVAVAAHTPQARGLTLEVAKLIHNAPSGLVPSQLICGGYGNVRDAAISLLSIPAADSYYGSVTMAEHCNHIHAGYG